MGIFGTGPFQNDSAMDLRDDLSASIVREVNHEIDEWCKRTQNGERIEEDSLTIPALCQFVLDLTPAVPPTFMLRMIERLMPLLHATMKYECEQETPWGGLGEWWELGESLDRFSVLGNIMTEMKAKRDLIFRISIRRAERITKKDAERITKKDLEDTLARVRQRSRDD